MAPRAGLLVRRGSERLFIPASVARHLVPMPRLSRVPWDSVQMALVRGDVVAVVELGEPSGMLVMCEISGECVALSGLAAERAGFWPASGTGIRVDDTEVPELDLAAALARFQTQRTEQKDSAP
jgi:hypothetical protein